MGACVSTNVDGVILPFPQATKVGPVHTFFCWDDSDRETGYRTHVLPRRLHRPLGIVIQAVNGSYQTVNSGPSVTGVGRKRRAIDPETCHSCCIAANGGK